MARPLHPHPRPHRVCWGGSPRRRSCQGPHGPSSGPTAESSPPDLSYEAMEDVGQCQLPPGPPACPCSDASQDPCPAPWEAGLPPPTISLPPSPEQHPGESQAHVTAAGRHRVIADSCAWHTLPGPPLPTVSPHKEEGQPPQEDLGRLEGKWQPPGWGQFGAQGQRGASAWPKPLCPGTLGVCAMGISETPPVCQAPAPGSQSQGLATPRHW